MSLNVGYEFNLVRITDSTGKTVVEFKHDDPSGAATALEDAFYDLRHEAADEAICDYIDSEAMNRSFHSE